MRVMADTNIIISALLFPASLPARVLLHIADHHDLVLCDHIVAELRDVVARKRPDLLGALDALLAQLPYDLAVAPQKPDTRIQDPKDQPILNAAVMAGVDIIVTGDKHFLQCNLERPQAMSPADFWQLEQDRR